MAKRYRIPFKDDENVLKLTLVMVAQLWIYKKKKKYAVEISDLYSLWIVSQQSCEKKSGNKLERSLMYFKAVLMALEDTLEN